MNESHELITPAKSEAKKVPQQQQPRQQHLPPKTRQMKLSSKSISTDGAEGRALPESSTNDEANDICLTHTRYQIFV